MRQALVALMRHAQIVQSSPRRFVGQRDLPLDDTGRVQAEAQGRRLALLHAQVPFTRVVASDLSRCLDTARLALDTAGVAGVEIIPEPALREVSLGAWEGLTTLEVRERFGDEYRRRGQDIAGTRPQGGESFEDVAARAWPVLDRLLDQAGPGRTLIVAHGGVNRVLLCRVLGLPLPNLFRLEQDYAGLSLIAPDQSGHPGLLCLNLPPGE